MAAISAEIKLSSFETYDEFIEVSKTFEKDTPIYIDSSLKNEKKGEDYIPELKKMGFNEVFLATGYPTSHFAYDQSLKVVGKHPPLNWAKINKSS